MNLRKVFVLALFLSLFVIPALTQAVVNTPNPSWTTWGSCPAITAATPCGNFLYRTRTCTGTRCPSLRVQSKICGYAPCPLNQNSAEFVEITGAPDTSTLAPNQEFTLTAKVKNTSNIFWPKQSTANLAKRIYGYRLAFVDADGKYTNIWDPSNSLTLNRDIATGSIATFSKKIKAPSRAGTYTLTLQMYQQNRGLFGPKSETKTYIVGGDTDGKSIGSVDVSNFNEAADAWARGVSKAVEWVTTGNINRVKISICPIGADTCILAKHNNTNLDNVLNDDDSALVTIPSNSTYTQVKIKVEDKTNSSRFGLSPVFSVGSSHTDVLANPTLDSYSDWDIKTMMKKLSWNPGAFSSSYVEIWMCPSTVVAASSDSCFKSYGVNDAISNSGSRDIGLPLGVTPGLWKVFITGTTNGTVGAGFTPVVRLVGGDAISSGISNVDISNFNEASDTWTLGGRKTVTWATTGTINPVDVLVCQEGGTSCLYLQDSLANSGSVGSVSVSVPTNIEASRVFIKVKSHVDYNKYAVSPTFSVGEAPATLASPYLTDTNDWNITGQTKTLKWAASAFNSGTGNVDIWMCKERADFSATNGNCLNSYFGVPNAGEMQIGLPRDITTGYWKVYITGASGDKYDGAGFTPRIKLVSDSIPPPATGPTWTAVGSCSLSCGEGTQTWTCAGTACPRAREVRACNVQACPINPAPLTGIQDGQFVTMSSSNNKLVGYSSGSRDLQLRELRTGLTINEKPNIVVFEVVNGDNGDFKLRCSNGKLVKDGAQGKVLNCSDEGREVNFCQKGLGFGTRCVPVDMIKVQEIGGNLTKLYYSTDRPQSFSFGLAAGFPKVNDDFEVTRISGNRMKYTWSTLSAKDVTCRISPVDIKYYTRTKALFGDYGGWVLKASDANAKDLFSRGSASFGSPCLNDFDVLTLRQKCVADVSIRCWNNDDVSKISESKRAYFDQTY
jgi:hypothetical protein